MLRSQVSESLGVRPTCSSSHLQHPPRTAVEGWDTITHMTMEEATPPPLSDVAYVRIAQLQREGMLDEFVVTDTTAQCRYCLPISLIKLCSNAPPPNDVRSLLCKHRRASEHLSFVRARRSQPLISSSFFVGASSTAEHAPDMSSALAPPGHPCCGFWRQSWRGRDAKLLLYDAKPFASCFPVPEMKLLMPDGEVVTGTFFHRLCQRSPPSGEPFIDFNCDRCKKIPLTSDFRQRLKRRSSERHAKCNLRYMSTPDLLDAAQRSAFHLHQERRATFLLCVQLAAANVSRASWRARVKESAGRKDVKKVTDELTKAYEDGKFEGKATLFNFISDLVTTVARSGRRGAVKYHKTTHRFFGVLRKLGGPRTQRFMVANLGGPSEVTTRQRWNRDKLQYMPGFKHIGPTLTAIEDVYRHQMRELDISYPVLCEAAEDETNILQEASFNASRDAVVGT